MRKLIQSLSARHTILVTSHILSEIEQVATRVAILLNGRLITVQSLNQDASPRLRLRVRGASAEAPQVLEQAAGDEHPLDCFVKFVGKMRNILAYSGDSQEKLVHFPLDLGHHLSGHDLAQVSGHSADVG